MRYLIIENYDACCGFSICANGVTERYDHSGENTKLCYDLYSIMLELPYLDDRKRIVEKYGNDYDLIILCEDGEIEVLKNDLKL